MIQDDKDIYTQIGIVRGNLDNCDGSRYHSIFNRVDDVDIYDFIKKTIDPIGFRNAKSKTVNPGMFF